MRWLNGALRYLEGRSHRQVLAFGFAGVAALGIVDFLTGYEAYFAFCYLLPISLVTWYIGLRPGMVFVALSAAVWILANHFAGQSYAHPFIYAWNVFSRVFVLALCAILLSALRRAFAFDRELSRRLKQTLIAQRRLNRILRDRLRLTDQLAAGVAHEVRNPLSTLLSGIEFLSRRERADPERSLLEDMGGAVSRAELIIRGLLDFSAPMRLNFAPCAAGEAIRLAMREAQHRGDEAGVTIRSPALPPIELRIDAPRIVQVVVNLLHNAIDASPRGGSVEIAARVASAREFDTDEMDGDLQVLAIDVDDDGPGLPADQLDHAFEPFYTTKSPGAGTGLGLSVSKRIVDDHCGLLRLANRGARGLRATLILPLGGTA